MYTVVHYTAMHFQGPQNTWGALAVCSVTQITTHHVYCSTLHCYALSGSSKYLGSISRLQCNIDNSHHVYCSTLHCYALSGSSKYLGSISCLQSNACRLTPCIL